VASEKTSNFKTSKLAIASLIFALLGVLLIYVLSEVCELYRIIKSCVLLATSIITIILVVLVVSKIKKYRLNLKGVLLTITGLVFAFYTIFFVFIGPRIRSVSYRMLCAQNLENLGKAILIYANDNDDKYPSSSNWCDLLIEHTDVTKEQFICPLSFWPVFSYGFNKNLDGLQVGDVPPNTVVLFEIEGGRNVSGGPELMLDDERDAYGTNVLHADFHVSFEPKGSKTSLNWNDKKSD